MIVTDLISEIHKLKQEIDSKTEEITKLQESKNELQNKLDLFNDNLLKEMITNKQTEIKINNLVATYFSKNEFTYGDENALLNYLKDKGLNQYITVKTTTKESINKNNLKKDLKSNEELKQSLKDFVGDKLIEYVVVTTEENHEKMLEHIEQGKKGK